MVQGFEQHQAGQCSLEAARNNVWNMLYNANPTQFPIGPSFISLYDLLKKCVGLQQIATTVLLCSNCMYTVEDRAFNLNKICIIGGKDSSRRLQYKDNLLISHAIYADMASSHHPCRSCPDIRLLNRTLWLVANSNLIVFEITDNWLNPDPTLSIDMMTGTWKIYTLRGLVYHGSGHFTCRIVDRQGQVWYNVSMLTGRKCALEGNLNGTANTSWLKNAHGRILAYAIYAIHV